MAARPKQLKSSIDFEAELLDAWVTTRMEAGAPFWFKEFYALRGYTDARVADMKRHNAKFKEACKRAHFVQECLLPKWALMGLVDKTTAIFLMKVKFGFIEKQQVEHSGGVQIVIKGDDAKL